MNLYECLKKYQPTNEQELCDKESMLKFIENNEDYLDRSNIVAHFSASVWTVNKERTKVLMVYHNIYNSWSWIGGHADGIEDLREVALRELKEETGVRNARLVSDEIFSIETLTVNGTFLYDQYTSSCTSSSVSTSVKDSNWKIASSSADKVCNTAYGYATAKRYLLGVAVQTVDETVSLSCSKTGVLS